VARPAHLARLLASTAAARARRGPLRPHWPLVYETAVAVLRHAMRYHPNDGDPRVIAAGRARMDALGDLALPGTPSLVPGALGGVPAASITAADADDLVVLYLHGGGYNFGSPRSHRGLIARFARTLRARVVGLDYRLAPEHPCPAAIDDALAAVRALYASTHPRRVVIAGDSAGGGLALATLHALRDAGEPQPAAAVLLSPWVDLTSSFPSIGDRRGFDYLDPNGVGRASKRYAGDLGEADPRVSPLFGDHHGIAPLLVLTGGVELLRDEDRELVARATAAGVDAVLHEAPDEVHVWPIFGRLSPATAPALAAVRAFVRARAPYAPARRAGGRG
jgi:monoterpene epsilon-lactone hydrolase